MNETTGRWSWNRQIFGGIFSAIKGSYGSLVTTGAALNDKHNGALGIFDTPSGAWDVAARIAGATAVSLRADPGLPVQSLPIIGMAAPPIASRFDVNERNTLLNNGISTFHVGNDGTCSIDSLITFYQFNAAGAPDTSYLYVDDLYKVTYILRTLRDLVQIKYARCKLAINGTRIDPGSNTVTPNMIRLDLIANYKTLVEQGVAQNDTLFAANLIVEINANNPNRVDVLYPTTLMGGIRGFAVLAQLN